MIDKQYRVLRKAMVNARDATAKAFSKVDDVMDLVPEDQWPSYHNLKRKLTDVYGELEKKINTLDQTIIKNG